MLYSGPCRAFLPRVPHAWALAPIGEPDMHEHSVSSSTKEERLLDAKKEYFNYAFIPQAGAYGQECWGICPTKVANDGYNYSLSRRSTRYDLIEDSSARIQ